MSANGQSSLSIQELLRLGQLGLELGYWDQAEGYFDRVLVQQPDHRQALLGKAAATRDTDLGLRLVAQVLAQNATDAEALALRRQLLGQADAPSPGPPPGGPSGAPASATTTPTPRPVAESGSPRRATSARWFWIIPLGVVVVVLLTWLARFAMDRATGWAAPWQAPVTTVAPLATLALPVAEASPAVATLERAQRSTALVLVMDPSGARISRGSGALVSAEGLVLTNYHVLTDESGALLNEQALGLVGLTRDVRQPPDEWYIGVLVAHDALRDLAVLRLVADRSGRPLRQPRYDAMSIANSDDLVLGQPLIGLGFPTLGGNTLTLTRGSMAGFATDEAGIQLGKTDSELLPGSSGGAVLNQQGELIGVVVAAHTEERTQGRLSYFVLANETLEVIRAGQQAARPQPSLDWLVAASERVLR